MEQEKEFVLNDDELTVTVNSSDDVFVMDEGKKVTIGRFEQKTIQHIDKDKIEFLENFLIKEKEREEAEMRKLEKALEQVKDYQDLDDKLVESVLKYQDKNKMFKEKVLALNDHIANMARKKQIEAQIKFKQPQIEAGNADLKKLQDALA